MLVVPFFILVIYSSCSFLRPVCSSLLPVCSFPCQDHSFLFRLFSFPVLIVLFSIMVYLCPVLVSYVLLVVFVSLVDLCLSPSWPFICSSFCIPFFFLTSPFLSLGYSFLRPGCLFLHSMSLAVLAVRYRHCPS